MPTFDPPKCFYRVSIKALVLDETRTKFLITKEEKGKWDLPGGGLDWGVSPQEDLAREIQEEMGLTATWVASRPSYFFVDKPVDGGWWRANVIYEATLDSLDFTPSDECVEIRFVTSADIDGLEVFPNIRMLAEQFNTSL
jgi:ADP-ribose pyrophosphatase YjhB (NUDIX family)